MPKINVIESRGNLKLKLARKVRDGRGPDLIFVEGLRLCNEVLRSNLEIRDCIVSDTFFDRVGDIMSQIRERRGVVSRVSETLFKTIADTDSPQGIITLCNRPPSGRSYFEKAIPQIEKGTPVIVFLQEINNPSNLGAITRTAEAAGVAGLICSANSADPFSPKALRASMGSAFRMPIWHGAKIDEVFDWAIERGMNLTAADTSGAKSYTKIDWRVPRLLVFGSEAHGLSQRDKTKLNDLVTIPMSSSVESLNLAVAAGVILFEARRQSVG